MSDRPAERPGWAIRGFDDAAVFRAHVEPWLLAREAEHNLLLGLLPRLASGEHGFEAPIALVAVERGGRIEGCAFRTPPFKLGLTRLPAAAIEPLAEHLAEIYPALPAVMGPEPEARRFGELWARSHGGAPRPGMRQRIHQLERVLHPSASPPGELRAAEPADLALVSDWIEAFARATGTFAGDPAVRAAQLVRDRALALWQHGEVRSMVAVAGWTPHGARVGYVYTPECWRGRGYATAAVARISEDQLRAGRRFCFLYTDLANPTANAIYARIGYRPVCDVVDVELDGE